MGKHHGASANDQLKCLVPDNKLRDDFFLCSMDTNACIPLPQDNTSYPACRETNITVLLVASASASAAFLAAITSAFATAFAAACSSAAF